MIRINEIKMSLDSSKDDLLRKAAKLLKIKPSEIKKMNIAKKSVDARKKDNVMFTYSVEIETDRDEELVAKANNPKISIAVPYVYVLPENKRKSSLRPVIVGFGPAGMLAGIILAQSGLRPIILERGKDIDARQRDVNEFWTNKVLNEESNVQYGEGGAGTFSDGKLNTGIKSPLCRKVLEELHEAGAPEEILYSAKPHVGTDRLAIVVKNIRKKIIALGGEIRLECKLEKLIVANKAIHGVTYRDKDGKLIDLETDSVILAIGHSARDTVEMLYNSGIEIIQKAFSVGARIEHPQKLINKSQYGKFANHKALGAADYKLACHSLHERGAYTFCMCPGGTVVAAASEKGGVVVNGMSELARDGENANSALLVGIEPDKFPSEHPLAGIYFQREIEQKAFKLAGSNYTVPAQLVGDFLNFRESKELGDVKPTCPTGVTLASLDECLPQIVTTTMRSAIVEMNKKLDGFSLPDAVLTAPETRSSSPVRILRDEFFQANIVGLYPCGEGAGYAGGIVSAAVDGIKCAQAVLEDEHNF